MAAEFKNVAVMFKDEDEVDGIAVGPVHVVDLDAMQADERAQEGPQGGTVIMVPVDETPEWERDFGWMTKPEALQIAQSYGVELGEA